MESPVLFDVPARSAPAIPFPAYESSMGNTLVWEADEQADSDELWRRAVNLQLLLDRLGGQA